MVCVSDKVEHCHPEDVCTRQRAPFVWDVTSGEGKQDQKSFVRQAEGDADGL